MAKKKPLTDEQAQATLASDLDAMRASIKDMAERLNYEQKHNLELRTELMAEQDKNHKLRHQDVQSPPDPNCSGYARAANVGEEFVERLYRGRDTLMTATASPITEIPNDPHTALRHAKLGSLETWGRVYEPGAELYALSQIVKMHERVDRLEEMLKFLCRRG